MGSPHTCLLSVGCLVPRSTKHDRIQLHLCPARCMSYLIRLGVLDLDPFQVVRNAQ